MVRVRIVEGPGAGSDYEFEQAVILGRLDSNDIPIHDPKSSREHAKIYKQGSKFAVVDLNSSNGTFVNGQQVTKQVLEHGDRISIGMVVMEFEDPEAEALKAAAPQRKSLDEAFEQAKKEPAAKGGTPEIVMTGHKPLQFSKTKGGLGFDFDQMSDTGRIIAWAVVIIIFLGLLWLSYSLVAG
ncbi:MAG: FHA domain-containing protein [Planctomycetota bacterium]